MCFNKTLKVLFLKKEEAAFLRQPFLFWKEFAKNI